MLNREPIVWGAVVLCLVGCGAKSGLRRERHGDQVCVVLGTPPTLTEAEISGRTQLEQADVYLLLDQTGSMLEEISAVQQRLQQDIVPGIAAAVPDVQFGVGGFIDFPLAPYGHAGDVPFAQYQPITADTAAVQSAVDSMTLFDGADDPESQVEALYQVASGEGLSPYVAAGPPCAAGHVGYGCFRQGSRPVVVVVTDAPFHNGPSGELPYSGIAPPPHGFDQAMDALVGIGARVIGAYSSVTDSRGRPDLEAAARATGTVREDGTELVFDIGSDGRGLGAQVVEAVEQLAESVPVDVDAAALPVPGSPVDATVFVESLEPLRATPASGYSRIEDGTFVDVLPGTEVTFLLRLRSDLARRGPEPVRTALVVAIRADRVTVLTNVLVVIVIPAEDGTGSCEPTL